MRRIKTPHLLSRTPEGDIGTSWKVSTRDTIGNFTAAGTFMARRLHEELGVPVGLLDISKMRGDIFLDRLEERFVERGVSIKRYSKPTFTKPAPVDLRQQIAVECNAVVEALAD